MRIAAGSLVVQFIRKKGGASMTKQTANLPLALPTAARVEQMQRDAYLRSKGIDPKAPFQLEIWPDAVREMPNDYARSAIFTVRNKKEPRASMEGAMLFHVEKAVKITFTGIELRAEDDELVFQQILDYAKHQALGEPVTFNLHQLCLDLGWPVSGTYFNKLRASISRLKANEIKVENERIGKGTGISLIAKYEFDGAGSKGSKYTVWIDPNLMLLFKYREVSPIARRMYDYFASHKQPFPLRLDTFQKMCGSTTKLMRHWRAMVKEACAELESAKLVKKAWVNDDCIFCER